MNCEKPKNTKKEKNKKSTLASDQYHNLIQRIFYIKNRLFHLGRRLSRELRFNQKLPRKFQIVHQFIYPKKQMTRFDIITVCCPAEEIYPTVSILLECLLVTNTHFPIRSETTPRRHMHRLGFLYKMINKIKVPFDNNFFVAQRGFYRKIDELRKAGALIMFHDETWVNIGEEKRSIWIDDRRQRRLRTTYGKDNWLRNLSRIVFTYTSI